MTKRNGYEVGIGGRWLFIGSRQEFPDGPEEVEVLDIRRGEVRVRFLDGPLEGKAEWHKPGRLYAPIDKVSEVQSRDEHERQLAGAALSAEEEWAVLTVGAAFGAEILQGNWRFGSDAERVAELLGVPVEEIVSVPLAEPDDDGLWHLPGRHSLHLARRLCARYPSLVHDYAAADLDQQLRGWEAMGTEPPSTYRGSYLLVCSWCHVDPDCDKLEVLVRQRSEIDWLFSELRRVVDRLGDYSPQLRSAALRRIREHYHIDAGDEVPRGWPGSGARK